MQVLRINTGADKNFSHYRLSCSSAIVGNSRKAGRYHNRYRSPVEAPCSPALAGQGIFDPQGHERNSNRALLDPYGCCPKTAGQDLAAVTAILGNGKAASPYNLFLHDKEYNHDGGKTLICLPHAVVPGKCSGSNGGILR